MLDSTSRGKTNDGHFLAYSEEFYGVVGDDPRFYTMKGRHCKSAAPLLLPG